MSEIEAMSYVGIAACGHVKGITVLSGKHLARTLAEWVRAGDTIEHWPRQKALDAFFEGLDCQCEPGQMRLPLPVIATEVQT